jgi:TolA-binding protein
MRYLPALLAIAVLAPLTLHAQPLIQSQEGIALENQILQLQQQVQQLQSNGGGSALGGGSAQPAPSGSAPAPDSSIVTNLLNQVGQLQTQIQQLNGEVDTLQNQVNTQHDQTEKEIGDINFKLSNGATPGTPGAPGAPASLTPPAGAVPTPPPAATASVAGTPKEILHTGLLAYEKGDYPTAEAAARKILTNASTSPQGYRAQYLLAQSLAAEHKPQDAAIAYDDAYNRDRTGIEAPESLLGLANSLAAINQNEAACDTLSSLNSQFPTPPAGMTARIVAASHKAHCS